MQTPFSSPAAAGWSALRSVPGVKYGQNPATLPIALVVLDSVSNELPALLPLVPALLRELASLKPKSYTLIKLP